MANEYFDGAYRELLDTIASGVAVYEVRNDGRSGSDYVILDFNRAALEHEGKSRDEVVGRSLAELRPNIDEFGLIPVFREVWQTGRPGFHPAKVYVDSSFAHWYENRVFRLSENRIVAIYDNVTERKQAEESLKDSEALLREVLDSMDKGIAIYEAADEGADFVFVGMNKAAEPITHYRIDEVLGLRITELFPGESSIGLIAKLKEAWETGQTVRIPLKQYQDERITQWVENTLLRLPSGKVVAVFEDTSERRRAEQALQESEARYRQAEHIGGVGHWEIDLRTEAIGGSEQARHIFGLRLADDAWTVEAVERCIPERQRVHQALVDLIERGTPYDLEYELVPADGSPRRTVTSVARLLRDQTGKPLKVAGVIQDITEKRQQQERIRELEHRSVQSQKLETVGRLAGGIAHDFNNLLTIINGHAACAFDELRPGDPLRNDVAEILEAGKRAAALTRQLLAFSRKQVMAPEVLNLNEIIRNLHKMLRRILGEDIEFETVLSAELGRVSADPSQLEQVLMNLAVNARDAMPQGGKLTIETCNVELDEAPTARLLDTEAGPYVKLVVRDSGEGMSAEVRARVFEPFYTTKVKGQGTGLGLATVYGIVKQSRGDIAVRSEPGQGASFEIFLPRVEESLAARAAAPTTTELRGSETVLVVEDERAVRELARRILEAAGYRAIMAANGGEALLVCEQHGEDIELMLTDVVMPLMSGRELAVRLKTIRPALKTLYMSGYTDDAIAHHGVLEAGTHLLAKPFDAATLLREIRRVLDSK